MKKTYQMPTTVVVNIQTEKMMSTSGFEGALGSTENAGSAALSREADLWSDDEDF